MFEPDYILVVHSNTLNTADRIMMIVSGVLEEILKQNNNGFYDTCR